MLPPQDLAEQPTKTWTVWSTRQENEAGGTPAQLRQCEIPVQYTEYFVLCVQNRYHGVQCAWGSRGRIVSPGATHAACQYHPVGTSRYQPACGLCNAVVICSQPSGKKRIYLYWEIWCNTRSSMISPWPVSHLKVWLSIHATNL